jgi:hypothetical protein
MGCFAEIRTVQPLAPEDGSEMHYGPALAAMLGADSVLHR